MSGLNFEPLDFEPPNPSRDKPVIAADQQPRTTSVPRRQTIAPSQAQDETRQSKRQTINKPMKRAHGETTTQTRINSTKTAETGGTHAVEHDKIAKLEKENRRLLQAAEEELEERAQLEEYVHEMKQARDGAAEHLKAVGGVLSEFLRRCERVDESAAFHFLQGEMVQLAKVNAAIGKHVRRMDDDE